MPSRHLLIALLAFACTGFAQNKPAYSTPRTIDGKPDLQGIWITRNAASFDVSEVADSRQIPYLPEALEREQKADRVDPVAHCSMPGVPRLTYMPFPIQIMQRPGYVVFLYEYQHDHRIIQTNGRPHLEDIDFQLGDSVGHWDGDTLVVDVADFNNETWFDASGNHHSTALKVVERYTRTGPDVMQYEATMTDPQTFSRPWTIRMDLHRNTDQYPTLLEYECHSYFEDDAIRLGSR